MKFQEWKKAYIDNSDKAIKAFTELHGVLNLEIEFEPGHDAETFLKFVTKRSEIMTKAIAGLGVTPIKKKRKLKRKMVKK